MDYFSMKRKKLQSLCKKHGIPANIKNKEMAEKLSAIFEGSGNTDDAGTGSQKDVPMKESDTVAGNHTDITLDQMDASPSGTAGGNEDACQVKSVPSSQELIGDQEESTMKLPLPEIRDDIGFLNVEENAQMSFDVAQVDDIKELHVEALAESHVILEEFGNNIVEGQVEEVSGKTDVLEEDNQGEVGGEGVYNDSNISEASKTCLDASIGTKDIGGKLKSAHKSCSEDSYSPSVHKSVVPEKPESTMKLPLPERRDDIGFLTVEENSQTHFDVAQVDDNKELHVEALAESHVISEEFGNNIVEGEVEEVSGKTDVLEEDNQGEVGDEVVYNDCNISEASKMCLDASIGTRDIDGKPNSAQKLCSEHSDGTPGTAKNEDTCSAKFEHVALEVMQIEAEKLDDTIDLAEDVFGSAKGAKITDANTDATVEHIPDEVYSSNFKDSDEISVHFPPTDPFSEVETSVLDVPKTFIPDTCGAEFVDDIGLLDDVESNVAEVEIERLNDMIGSFEDVCKAVKDREENVKHGSIKTPGEVQMFGDNILDAIDADTCQNMLNSSQKTGLEAEQEEGMQSDKMEKEDIQVEDSMLFENSVADNDTGGISHKRKWSDVDNTNDQNSDEKEKTDEFAQTMSKPGKFLGTIYVDEVTDQVKLECSPKGTPIASSKKSIIFSPRNNIKFDKKEQVGSTIPKNKVAKRTALQDLQQH